MKYPCHICANTMIHGQTYTFPRVFIAGEPSCGKVYYMKPAHYMAPIEHILLDCFTCNGTGLVDERRNLQRRNIIERRYA